MSILICDAELADIDAITAIYRDAVDNGVASFELSAPDTGEMTRRFSALREQNYPYIVARDEKGCVLGYAYAGAYRTRPAYRWTVEDSVYIAPEARGKGIGKALLEAIIVRCCDLGFRQMIAIIGGSQPASVALHAATGFEFSGTLRATGFKHGQWLDTTIYQRQLGSGDRSDPDPDVYPGTLLAP